MANCESQTSSLACAPPKMSGSISNSSSNNNNNNNNNNSSSNNNNDVPEDCSAFKYYMEKCYVLPLELKNDIIYCQRALRDFLKVHGLVSDVFKEQADADPVQMQRILEELESEVYEINSEQQFLMLRLTEDLDSFYKKLEENNIQTVPELGNEYISSLIVPLIGDSSYKIHPESVLTRDNEEMLIRKHFLISQDDEAGIEPLKLSELDDNVPLMLINAQANEQFKGVGGSDCIGLQLLPKGQEELLPSQLEEQLQSALKSATTLPGPPALKQSPPQSVGQQSTKEPARSLLIPRGMPAVPEQQGVMAQQLVLLPPPPLVASKQRGAARNELKPQVKRNSTSPPPLAPITKVPPAPELEVIAQSRMNLRQALRRARKTKQQPRKFDDEDVLELSNDKPFEMPPLCPPSTVPVKSKHSKHMDVLLMPVVAPAPAAPAMAKKTSKQIKTRNAHGAGRSKLNTSPTPPAVNQQAAAAGTGVTATAATGSSGSSGSSDDIHQELQLEQQRLCASAAQWRDEPRETRVLPTEYGQEGFLGMFELYTDDMVRKLKQRHSKRKRRTVQNASGVDFHYGQQLAGIDAVRQKKLKDKPEFLLSPKDKRLQAKKAHKAAVVAAGRKSKSKSPEKAEDAAEASKPKVKESKKRADNSLTCQNCHGHYQLDCHEESSKGSKAQFQLQGLGGRCPRCSRDAVPAGRIKVAS